MILKNLMGLTKYKICFLELFFEILFGLISLFEGDALQILWPGKKIIEIEEILESI